jgi:transcriptional adapter 3
MAPTNVSSKGKAKPGSKPSATPRSRNTTPLPNVRSSAEPSSSSSASYFNKPLGSYLKKCDVTVEEILESGGSASSIPSGTKLLAMRDKIESIVLKSIETRCTHSESVLRELQHLRKTRAPRECEKDKDPEDRDRKHKLKKVAKKHDEDGKHPPTTGAHGVTRQDGVDVHKGMHLHFTGPIPSPPALSLAQKTTAMSPRPVPIHLET